MIWIIFKFFIIRPEVTITLTLAAIPISFFPDVDQNFKKTLGHRNWFTHSIILWLIIYIFNIGDIMILTMMLGVGIHCLSDCRFRSEKQKGYYTIKWFKGKGLDGFGSTLYLTLNFIVSLSLFLGVVLVN